jgi:hypothetical protein
MIAVLITSLLLVAPAQLFAKGDTVRIIIKGADLKAPIEITDSKTLARFNIWTGPGTSSDLPGFDSNSPSFIIDWSQGPVTERPTGLQRYQVCFYSKLPNERLSYVVFYEYDPVIQRGYIYLPGRTDEWYRLNVSTIFRGIEGKWFRAWSVWDDVATPLIAGAKATASK